ncbi:zinc finger CCCH-type with G patch domain-containing protein [Sorex fumeus]|uniref:zinc finger CCCH-type with G patch domain-containing protein n=1 Tax=Sorex fumeus TaxID=62283 RepID=UPI0024AE63F4|nr:zinc finger CCCH-type with G patch domain-containing protein [Sorex fumeus]
MDEASLEAALRAAGAQLQQVERALGAGLDPAELADLRQLRGDLRELVALTEASLESVRQSRRLATLAGPAGAGGAGAAGGAEAEDAEEEEGEGPGPAPDAAPAAADPGPDPAAWAGRTVRAPFRGAWGPPEHHNAMVVGAEPAGVRVLCLCPTRAALKPCPFFLDARCRFQDSCRFSHGQVVSVDELQPFQPPDLSSLQAGSACLAKHEDGLWHPARVLDVDSGYYTVRFDTLPVKEAVLEGDSVLPPLHAEPPASSDSEGSDTDDASYARVVEPDAAPSGPCSSAFGGWEVHTRGVGSRLLAKMGYEPGKGLGPRGQGRVEPIHAVVLPRGKSLDQCAEILQRKTKGGQAGAPKPPKSRRRGAGAGAGGRSPPRSVFDFLNSKLQGQTPKAPPEAGAAPPGGRKRGGKDLYHAGKSAKRALGLELFHTQEKIEQALKDIRGIQEALVRNSGRHGVTVAQLQEKLAGAQQHLGRLRAQEAGLQQEQSKADTHKKMTEF